MKIPPHKEASGGGDPFSEKQGKDMTIGDRRAPEMPEKGSPGRAFVNP